MRNKIKDINKAVWADDIFEKELKFKMIIYNNTNNKKENTFQKS